MSKQVHDERGMTTAEYALGTIAVIALVAVVIAYLNGDAFDAQVSQVASQLIQQILKFIG